MCAVNLCLMFAPHCISMNTFWLILKMQGVSWSPDSSYIINNVFRKCVDACWSKSKYLWLFENFELRSISTNNLFGDFSNKHMLKSSVRFPQTST
jgi:hypothetical protein